LRGKNAKNGLLLFQDKLLKKVVAGQHWDDPEDE
jgi:hypothetical protein